MNEICFNCNVCVSYLKYAFYNFLNCECKQGIQDGRQNYFWSTYICQDIIVFQVFQDIAGDYMFLYLPA